MRRDLHVRAMTESKRPLDAFDELEPGKGVRMTFEEGTFDEGFRPDDPFETEVEWVHSRRDETDMTVTYRAEFAPAEENPDANLYFMEMRVPTEADPEVTALMAESNDAGDRSSWRIAVVEGFSLFD